MRLFFKLLYHQFAWSYDLVAASVSLGKWKRWIYTVIPYLPEGRLLELGFGPGHLQVALKAQGRAPVGLDESAWMAAQAQARLRSLGFEPGLANGLSQRLPFASGAFCSIVATFPSEYIIDPNTIKECYRVLQPGGVLVLLPVAWITGKGLLHHLAASLFRVTGQAPELDERFIQPYLVDGFETQQIITKELPGSKLLILILKRRS